MTTLQSLKANDKVCQALAKQLVEAKSGQVHAIAIVTVGEDGRPNAIFAGDTELSPSVNLGIDVLKATILSQITGAAQSGLIRQQ